MQPTTDPCSRPTQARPSHTSHRRTSRQTRMSTRSSPIRSRTPATARTTGRANDGAPSVSMRVGIVNTQVQGLISTMKKNKKSARTVQKEQRAMQTELDEFKNQTYNNLQDVIKAITDDIEYKDAFMRVQNKQLVSQILGQSSESKNMEAKLMQIDRRMQSTYP